MQELEHERWLAAHYFQAHLVDTPVSRQMFRELIQNPEKLHDFVRANFPTDKKSRLLDSRLEQIENGVRFTYWGHPDFPMQFQWMDYSPFLISFKGQPAWLFRPGLAVVGSREMQRHTAEWLEIELGALLETEKIFIASGGARGVDQKAHELSIRKQCPTVVVLPSGLGRIYPSAIRDWEPQLLATGGCWFSEYNFDQEIRRHHFQARNRLISALGVCTLIAQASERSGTLITAHRALEQGRTVWVVPSHPTDMASRGGLRLLVDGAALIRDAHDLRAHWRAENPAQGHFRPTTPSQQDLPLN